MQNNAKKKLIIISAIVFVALVAGLYIYLYVIPDINDSLTETYIVGYGAMETSYNGQCIVVRDETCYTSEYSGTASFYIAESEKTRIGTAICDIYSGGNKYGMYCQKTGFVSYYHDGYEELLRPQKIISMDPASYLALDANPEDMATEELSSGNFVYKLVDGDNWYIMIPVSEGQFNLFNIGGNLSLVLDDGTVLKAKAERIVGETSLAVMARVLSYYPDFCKIRTIDIKIITKETEGLKIPDSAIGYVNEKAGVYVLGTDGEYHFTRINVVDNQNGYSLVSEDEFTESYEDGSSKIISTISLYDEILTIAK